MEHEKKGGKKEGRIHFLLLPNEDIGATLDLPIEQSHLNVASIDRSLNFHRPHCTAGSTLKGSRLQSVLVGNESIGVPKISIQPALAISG